MIQFNKSDISQKTSEELHKDLFESNFHHENYIEIVIEILHERGITTSDIFKDVITDDLVVTYCFDRKKYKIPYILLVKEELLNRNYDPTIQDVEANMQHEPIFGDKEKFETPPPPKFNDTRVYDEAEPESSNRNNYGKYIGVGHPITAH